MYSTLSGQVYARERDMKITAKISHKNIHAGFDPNVSYKERREQTSVLRCCEDALGRFDTGLFRVGDFLPRVEARCLL
jgi:hypothetical protein